MDLAFPDRGIGRVLARGYLELLWEACYESGEEYVGTPADIEHLVGWEGEAGMLTHALVEAGAPEGHGFLEPVSEAVDGGQVTYRVHDLWHHAPEYVAKRRKRELERQQKAAPTPVRRTADTERRPSMCQDEVPPPPSHSPSPSPSHKEISAETSSAPVAVLTFPTVGPVPEWALSESQVDEWARLFPTIDILAEARKALAWLQASPGRRKTSRGMPKFFVHWLSRANDSGRGSRTSAVTEPTAKEAADARAYISRMLGCPHKPKCDSHAACIRRVVLRLRGIEAAS